MRPTRPDPPERETEALSLLKPAGLLVQAVLVVLLGLKRTIRPLRSDSPA